jgi:hypothetical protein
MDATLFIYIIMPPFAANNTFMVALKHGDAVYILTIPKQYTFRGKKIVAPSWSCPR